MKKKAVVVANTSAQGLPSEDSFHASGSEDANRSFRKADLMDSKSIDSGRSSDDEDDEEVCFNLQDQRHCLVSFACL